MVLRQSLLFAGIAVAFISRSAGAADLTPAQIDFFENKIRPLLADNCYKCHSTQAEKVKGGLLLDSRETLLKGGDSGPVLVPGDPDASLLIKAVRYTDPDLQMPKDQKLPEDEIADLEAWVKMGAPDPRTATADQRKWTDNKTNHWAWQPVEPQAIPNVSNPDWCQTPVDHFILAKLDANGLKPNPPTDKRTLIRRATFDLIGLPPTPEEVQDFVSDPSTNAFAKVVDRLLASPHYGERWGRHWLDVARYSDTKGQPRRNTEDNANPFAWTYRDYVIRSFNENKPYNIFILEQLAADRLLAMPTWNHNPTNLAALGFLTVGDHYLGMQNDILNDRIDVVCKGLLALTVTCARCHDHKFDPIPQKDYYSLRGIFDSSVEPKIEPVIGKVSDTSGYLDYYRQREALARDEETIEASLPKLRKARDQEGVKKTQKALRDTEHAISQLELTNDAAPPRAMILEDTVRGHDSPVFIRGEAGNKGEIAPRRFLQVLSGPVRPVYTNGSGRLELALAIASRNNPLTARVMVNRLWLHHFGEGIVSSPDDFGMMSEPPSHPELLDYLALNFMTNGWNLKKTHRLIMLSSVYQESSANSPRYAQTDPGNRLLWRANIRRLEFEPLRDSLLALGGTLDTNLYGRPVDLRQKPDSTRRTIYDYVDRANIPDVLINFDFATPDMVTGLRHVTTVPQQALYLMNSPLVINLARRLVAMPDFVANADDAGRLGFLYERIYQRPPSAEELELGLEFVNQTPLREDLSGVAANDAENAAKHGSGQAQYANRKGFVAAGGRRRAPLTSWEEYAQALLQANETSFVN
ncbi:MAG: PSD1 and planctomycete cytochrome C domain-containing protein [Verrucomicrobiota bacterium]